MLHFKWISLSVLLSLLVGCGSSANKRVDPISNQKVPEQVTEEPKLVETPDYYLQQAQLSEDSDDNAARNQWLVRAAAAFKQQEQCPKSNKILQLSLPELSNLRLINHAHLIMAECHWTRGVSNWTEFAHDISKLDPAISHPARIQTLYSHYYAKTGSWLKAAKSLASVFNGDQQSNETIWYYLQALELSQLETATLREPILAPWLQLSLIVKQYGLNTPQLRNMVQDWQRQYADHPLSQSLPTEVQLGLDIEPVNIQKVAVLLPLSGRLSQQGLAIKEGALSAYFRQKQATDVDDQIPPPLIHFFDTQSNDMPTLADQVKDYDVVVGPLIKENLADFINAAPTGLNIVGLNRLDLVAPSVSLEPAQPLAADELVSNVEQQEKPGMRVFFALSPEDEAVQLALKVFKTGALQPIVISHESGAAKRMADTFMQTWETALNGSGNMPEQATFKDNKSMRTGLTALLDVKQSKSRIDAIENLTSQQIHSVPRNRRDIDAIVLFATPEQTELLNPIVEASLSPFNNKSVPVYASSRSFSENFSKNSLRDLRNITFTDMPWMLPENQYEHIKQEVTTIWPERNDTLKRLFALGFDSFQVLQNLPALVAMPQVSAKGLTGTLSVDNAGNIVRLLPFGKITETEVILLAMDQ